MKSASSFMACQKQDTNARRMPGNVPNGRLLVLGIDVVNSEHDLFGSWISWSSESSARYHPRHFDDSRECRKFVVSVQRE